VVSGYEWDADEWILTTTLAFLLCAVLVLVILRVAHAAAAQPRHYARHLLDGQFARGELSIEEYERRRRLIERF
jgi:uncharacterized membrane protein